MAVCVDGKAQPHFFIMVARKFTSGNDTAGFGLLKSGFKRKVLVILAAIKAHSEKAILFFSFFPPFFTRKNIPVKITAARKISFAVNLIIAAAISLWRSMFMNLNTAISALNRARLMFSIIYVNP
jgi:hypothetical protein